MVDHANRMFAPTENCFTPSCTDKHNVNDKPNIILVMDHDMGYSDLSFFGSLTETPNIDNLAFNGLIFSQFYNTSRCCPSRSA